MHQRVPAEIRAWIVHTSLLQTIIEAAVEYRNNGPIHGEWVVRFYSIIYQQGRQVQGFIRFSSFSKSCACCDIRLGNFLIAKPKSELKPREKSLGKLQPWAWRLVDANHVLGEDHRARHNRPGIPTHITTLKGASTNRAHHVRLRGVGKYSVRLFSCLSLSEDPGRIFFIKSREGCS